MRSAAWRSGGGERRCPRPPGAAPAAGPSRALTAPWTPRRAWRAPAGGTRYQGRAPGTAWPRPHAGADARRIRPRMAAARTAGGAGRARCARRSRGAARAGRPRAQTGQAAASPRVGADVPGLPEPAGSLGSAFPGARSGGEPRKRRPGCLVVGNVSPEWRRPAGICCLVSATAPVSKLERALQALTVLRPLLCSVSLGSTSVYFHLLCALPEGEKGEEI